jgi:Tfp pilus assembly protein PilF
MPIVRSFPTKDSSFLSRDSRVYISIVHLLILLVVGLLGYGNTFSAPFIFDDDDNIIKNPLIKDFHYFRDPSRADSLLLPTGGLTTTWKSRVLGYLTFALNYRLHGLDVTGYHAVNLTIHILNAFLLYWLILLTFRTPHLQTSTLRDRAGSVALLSALLFVSHPVQTQAVTYIVQRLASLATLFYLLSLALYVRGRLYRAFNLRTVVLYSLSLISAVCAMKSKEISLTLPVVITLYEFSFFRGAVKRRVLLLLPLLLTGLIIPLSYLHIDRPIGEMLAGAGEATRLETEIPRLQYLFTELRVIVTYIRLLILPVNQNLDYDFPVYRSFLDREVFLSFLFLVSLLCFAGYMWFRSRVSDGALRVVGFGILWFFIALSVESGLIPIVDVIFEHRLYLPSVGVCSAAGTGGVLAAGWLQGRRKSAGRVVMVILGGVVLALTAATYARNGLWKSELTLWQDVVRKSPEKARPHNNLGHSYKSQGLFDQAIKHYRIAVILNPGLQKAHYNLGFAYKFKGLIDKAIEHYKIAVKLNPEIPEVHNNLGNAYRSKGLIERAIQHYQTAIELNPDYPDPYVNLGNVFQSQGLTEKAIEYYQSSIELSPGSMEPHYNLGVAYRSQGLLDQAQEHFETAARLKQEK